MQNKHVANVVYKQPVRMDVGEHERKGSSQCMQESEECTSLIQSTVLRSLRALLTLMWSGHTRVSYTHIPTYSYTGY